MCSQPHCRHRRRRKDQQGRQQLKTPRVDGQRDDDPHRQRDPTRTPEREIERREEDDQASGTDGPESKRASTPSKTKSKNRAHGGEERESVPVAKWLREAIDGGSV